MREHPGILVGLVDDPSKSTEENLGFLSELPEESWVDGAGRAWVPWSYWLRYYYTNAGSGLLEKIFINYKGCTEAGILVYFQEELIKVSSYWVLDSIRETSAWVNVVFDKDTWKATIKKNSGYIGEHGESDEEVLEQIKIYCEGID